MTRCGNWTRNSVVEFCGGKSLQRNMGRCKLCDEVIESTNRHDMVWCKGQHFAVDGGLDYMKRSMVQGVDYSNWEELSVRDEV